MRIGIFHFYEEFGFVDEYIEILLDSMMCVLSKLIIICNCEVTCDEMHKLEQYSKKIYVRKNVGYDAG